MNKATIVPKEVKEEGSECEPGTRKFLARATLFIGRSWLYVVLVFYVGFGALVFQKLEGPAETYMKTNLKQRLADGRENSTRTVFEISSNHPGSPDKFNSSWLSALDAYEQIIDEVTSQGVSILKPETRSVWNYARSAIFASTVITTIGYGNITPKTYWGRAFCMAFALIGIPLTLTVLAQLGKRIASLLTRLYARTRSHFPDKITVKKIEGKSIPIFMTMVCLLCYTSLGAFLFRIWEPWSFFDSFYFCFITLTTIGFGDLVPVHTTNRLISMMYVFVGLALTSTAIELVQRHYTDSWEKVREKAEHDAEQMTTAGINHAGNGVHIFDPRLHHPKVGPECKLFEGSENEKFKSKPRIG